VYPGKRVLDGNWIEPTEEQVEALAKDNKKIPSLRKRLASLSWFLSALKEYLAAAVTRKMAVVGLISSRDIPVGRSSRRADC
jgi:hypothetical protein